MARFFLTLVGLLLLALGIWAVIVFVAYVVTFVIAALALAALLAGLLILILAFGEIAGAKNAKIKKD